MNISHTIHRDTRKPDRAASVKAERGHLAAFTAGSAYQAGPTPKSTDLAPITLEQLGDAYRSGYGATVHALQAYGLNPSDAEEIGQQAWVKAFANYKQLRDPRHLLAWVRMIAINLLRDEHRRQARLRPLLKDYPAPAYERLRSLDLDRLIAMFPTDRREVLRGLVAGYSPEEMAEVFGISRGAVLARISRAMKAARRQVQGK